MDKYMSNKPNAAKLISSLRNTGYDSYAAIEDIIDNSIDAGAREIKVSVEKLQGGLEILISDNGSGMSMNTLDEALKLGSATEKDVISDLGKFGMGLCTASISMARCLEVISADGEGVTYYSKQDLDEVVRVNEFVKILRPASAAEEKFLKSNVGNKGTIVKLSNVDRLSDSNTMQFAAKLSRDIGRIYRKFILSGVVLSVNGKMVEANDPLMLSHEETTVYSDETYELPQTAVAGKKESIRVKIVILPDFSQELMKEHRINMHSQGFYVLRNNREVANGESLKIFTKHNDFNRLRIELSFSAAIDNEMGVKFTKDGINPNQSIVDFLKQELNGQISSIRTLTLKNKRASKESEISHTDSEAVIAQRAKLLITPNAIIESRGPRTKNDEREEADPGKKRKERKDFSNTKVSPTGIGARFETAAMGREGTLYEAYQEGKVIIIRWNSDHPFYDRVILQNKDDKNIVSALDYLVFALASAELKNTNEENVELMANIKSVMSTNLRALLS